MVFPVVAGRTSGAATANVTTYPLPLPASIAAGNLLIVAGVKDGTTLPSFGTTVDGVPMAGWNVLDVRVNAGIGAIATWLMYKVATGNETSPLNITGASEFWAANSWRITGYDASLSPDFSVTSSASTGSTNPNALTLDPAAWGAEDTLWLAWAGGDHDSASSVPITGTPAGFSNSTQAVPSSGTFTDRVVAIGAERNLNAASLDPTTFTKGTSDQWTAYTVAVRPSPATPNQPILSSNGFYSASGTTPTNSFTLVTGTNRRLFVSVSHETAGVTVTGITYGGVALSLVSNGTVSAASTNTARVEWWSLRQSQLPANGAQNIVVTLSGSAECYIGAILVSNTSQSETISGVVNSNTASGTTLTSNVTSPAATSLILSCCNKNDAPPFTNYTIGGSRAMGRGSSLLPTGGAWIMTAAREPGTSGSIAVVSTSAAAVRQVMSTLVLAQASAGSKTSTIGSTGPSLTMAGTVNALRTGVGAATAAAASLASTGQSRRQSSALLTGPADTLASTAATRRQGSSAATAPAYAIASTGSVSARGSSLAATSAATSLSSTSTVRRQGVSAITGPADTMSATATVAARGSSLALTGGAPTIAASAQSRRTGAVAAAGSATTVSSTGSTRRAGAATLTGAGAAASATATSRRTSQVLSTGPAVSTAASATTRRSGAVSVLGTAVSLIASALSRRVASSASTSAASSVQGTGQAVRATSHVVQGPAAATSGNTQTRRSGSGAAVASAPQLASSAQVTSEGKSLNIQGPALTMSGSVNVAARGVVLVSAPASPAIGSTSRALRSGTAQLEVDNLTVSAQVEATSPQNNLTVIGPALSMFSQAATVRQGHAAGAVAGAQVSSSSRAARASHLGQVSPASSLEASASATAAPKTMALVGPGLQMSATARLETVELPPDLQISMPSVGVEITISESAPAVVSGGNPPIIVTSVPGVVIQITVGSSSPPVVTNNTNNGTIRS